MNPLVVVFGQASRGAFHQPICPRSLNELNALLGPPPEGSLGLNLAVQTLLFNNELVFFRVEEEGFSRADYWKGSRILLDWAHTNRKIAALGLPGCGDKEIIAAVHPILSLQRAVLILGEKDLYDYLMQG